jgi:NAD(P)-dependent dehydrogenase (short-subunit alcohol dehydrogenase family)
MVPPYGVTKDGFESQFGVNYIANFLLVQLLLPKIKVAGPSSSIIIVASSAVRNGVVHFGDVGFSVRDAKSRLYLVPLHANW